MFKLLLENKTLKANCEKYEKNQKNLTKTLEEYKMKLKDMIIKNIDFQKPT